MSHDEKPQDAAAPPSRTRRPWAQPKLIEYGHIGKLTQGNSGSRPETSGKMIVPCL